MGNRPCCREKYCLRYATRLDGDRAETDAGIDVSVVNLVDSERSAVADNQRERASGSDNRAILRPGEKILRCRLASLRRVGEGKMTGRWVLAAMMRTTGSSAFPSCANDLR